MHLSLDCHHRQRTQRGKERYSPPTAAAAACVRERPCRVLGQTLFASDAAAHETQSLEHLRMLSEANVFMGRDAFS